MLAVPVVWTDEGWTPHGPAQEITVRPGSLVTTTKGSHWMVADPITPAVESLLAQPKYDSFAKRTSWVEARRPR